jgi:hypothetical protein
MRWGCSPRSVGEDMAFIEGTLTGTGTNPGSDAYGQSRDFPFSEERVTAISNGYVTYVRGPWSVHIVAIAFCDSRPARS